MTYKQKIKNLVSKTAFKNLERYAELLEEKNKVMNLTGFKGDKLWEEGIYESIIVLKECIGYIKDKKILDIGAGAGFPSVPYLIVNPSNELTIYEPIKKRTLFLKEVKEKLNLNINIKCIRSEDSDQEEVFDYITARAVTNLKALIEISHKPAKIGATFIYMKGPRSIQELVDAKIVIHNFSINPSIKKVLLKSRENFVIMYDKTLSTPERFPRPWKEIIA